MIQQPSLDTLTSLIEEWGEAKGILPNPSAEKQFSKCLEEVGELRTAIDEADLPEIRDAIGDIFVTLVMQTKAWDLDMADCVNAAYSVISKRTGRMVDGVFVKDD